MDDLRTSLCLVATVLTACGIETFSVFTAVFVSFDTLQQCLPLAVLKLDMLALEACDIIEGCNSAYRLRY